MMRNRFHSICPYFAMFPERFVRKHLAWAKGDDVVFDPFTGRGTTVFEALLAGRPAAGIDLSPVAVCVSRAKAHLPELQVALARLRQLEDGYEAPRLPRSEFFRACYHPDTLRQILYLRANLNWKRSSVDCFLAAVALGRLHGESKRSPAYFSNQMPRTISTKPAYSVRWWKENQFTAPKRDVFAVMRSDIRFRYESDRPALKGQIRMGDARRASGVFPELKDKVGLVITSPPYLDTTNFMEDQWLRLWFLGGDPLASGFGRGDHRHVNQDLYWTFLQEAWRGMAAMLRDKARIIIRIGGCRQDIDEIEGRLRATLKDGLDRRVRLVERKASEIYRSQLQSFRPTLAQQRSEYDFHWSIS